MATRSTTEKRRVWLAGELEVWQAQGLLTHEQAAGILNLYGSSHELAERRRSKALLALMGAAAFLFGLGVLLLVGYNWEALPKGGKLVLIFGCILGANLTGLRLRFARGSELGSEVVFFFGCLLYGAGIALVAQIFNINAHYPDGVWWWAIGVLPFALSLRTPLLHVLLVALLAIWCGLEVIGDPSRSNWLFGRPAFVPNGAYTLPLLALPGLAWAYRRQSAVTVGLYVPLLVWWLVLQPITWHFEWEAIYFIGTAGGALLLVAEAHPKGSPMAIPYRLYGTGLVAGVLVPLGFHGFVTEAAREGSHQGLVGTVVLGGLVLVTLGLLVVTRSQRPGTLSPGEGLLDLVRRHWYPAGFVLFMLFAQFWGAMEGGMLLTVVLANVAMVVMAFWLMQTGLREDRGRPFAAGVLFFVLWAIMRYVDLFGEMGGMLGAAAMFFLCGGGLFGVALFWRRRKRGQDA